MKPRLLTMWQMPWVVWTTHLHPATLQAHVFSYRP